MKLLPEYTDEQVLELAERQTPTMKGKWTLTAPDGVTWDGETPMDCVIAKVNARVPPIVALARIRRAMMEDDERERNGL